MKLIRMRRTNYCLIVISFLLTAISCTKVHNPKPKGYNRFDLPPHEYISLQEDHPYQFDVSRYSEVRPHKSAISEPHWIDIHYPALNATVEITYKDLRVEKNAISGVVFDAHKLTNKHNIKAYAIDEYVISTDKGYTASIFELEGEVPSQFQFFVTDSSSNFIRGALYFPISTKNDSLAPAIEYIKKDIFHLLNSLEWKDS